MHRQALDQRARCTNATPIKYMLLWGIGLTGPESIATSIHARTDHGSNGRCLDTYYM